MMRISRIRRYPIKGLAGEDLKTRGWHGFRPPSMATAASRSIGTEYRPRRAAPTKSGAWQALNQRSASILRERR